MGLQDETPSLTRPDFHALIAVWVNGPAPVDVGNQYNLRRLVKAGYLEYLTKADRFGYRHVRTTAAGDRVARAYRLESKQETGRPA